MVARHRLTRSLGFAWLAWAMVVNGMHRPSAACVPLRQKAHCGAPRMANGHTSLALCGFTNSVIVLACDGSSTLCVRFGRPKSSHRHGIAGSSAQFTSRKSPIGVAHILQACKMCQMPGGHCLKCNVDVCGFAFHPICGLKVYRWVFALLMTIW